MLLTNPVIQFENVSVCYRVPHERVSGIKEFAIRFLQQRLTYSDFWALKDVSFEIHQGETFGVIGRNGAGKSTLLKVMARVLKPTEGRVVLHKRIAPLLELGAGFHPELTGRENIYLNSALLGRTRNEVDALFDSIVEFAEIGDFIEAPIRTYSTGMVARLGFAIASSVRPPILLVDEVLSVGDAPFQKKCLDRMLLFREQGTTVVLVSHSLSVIEAFCDQAVWLEKGRAKLLGPAESVAGHYTELGKPESEAITSVDTSVDLQSTLEQARKMRSFTRFGDSGDIYPTKNLFNPQAGSITVWIKLPEKRDIPEAIIFHTEDSRFVLFISSYTDPTSNQYIRVAVARAGGNRRVMDTFYGTYRFPEVAAAFDDPSIETSELEIWRFLVMTWNGYPDGQLRIYLDGDLRDERTYSSEYNDNRPHAESLAIGMRPTLWKGEVVNTEVTGQQDLRPQTNLALEVSGAQIKDLRLYRHCLSEEEITGQIQDPPDLN